MADSTISNLGASITALADNDRFVADDTSEAADTSYVEWSTIRQQVTPFDVPVTVAVTDACALIVETSSGSPVLTIATDHSASYPKVGIGTNTACQMLHIYGPSPIIRLEDTDSGNEPENTGLIEFYGWGSSGIDGLNHKVATIGVSGSDLVFQNVEGDNVFTGWNFFFRVNGGANTAMYNTGGTMLFPAGACLTTNTVIDDGQFTVKSPAWGETLFNVNYNHGASQPRITACMNTYVRVDGSDAFVVANKTNTNETFRVDTSASKAYVNGREISEVLITSCALTSDTACIVFDNLPTNYRGLRLDYKLRSTRTTNVVDALMIQINASGTSNYYYSFNWIVNATAVSAGSDSSHHAIVGQVTTYQGASYVMATGYINFFNRNVNAYQHWSGMGEVMGTISDPTTYRTNRYQGVFTQAASLERISLYPQSGCLLTASGEVYLYGVA